MVISCYARGGHASCQAIPQKHRVKQKEPSGCSDFKKKNFLLYFAFVLFLLARFCSLCSASCKNFQSYEMLCIV